MVSRRPAVVCKAVGPLITENDVIQESDAEQFSGLFRRVVRTWSSGLGAGSPDG